MGRGDIPDGSQFKLVNSHLHRQCRVESLKSEVEHSDSENAGCLQPSVQPIERGQTEPERRHCLTFPDNASL